MVIYLTHNMMGSLRSAPRISAPTLEAGTDTNFNSSKKTMLSFMISLRAGLVSNVRVKLSRLHEVVVTRYV